jgi:hypothetical protein
VPENQAEGLFALLDAEDDAVPVYPNATQTNALEEQ